MNYNLYSTYLKNKYGERVYKIPINLPVTCPNRDGEVSTNGCTFCGDSGAGFYCFPSETTIAKQIEDNIAYIGKRYKAKKFIAYYQNFSNTYLPFDQFKKYIEQGLHKDVVELSISTRPDCINTKICEYLENLQKTTGINVTIELGLQTVNYKSLIKINRGHTLAEYIYTANIVKKHNLMLTTHVILNLPYDDETDVIETAKIISAVDSDFAKLHALFIVKDTEMARQYLEKEFTLISDTEYKNRVKLFLQYLNPDISIQRLIGRVDEGEAIFANWGRSSWAIKDEIEAEMLADNINQGDKFDYLEGKSIKKYY